MHRARIGSRFDHLYGPGFRTVLWTSVTGGVNFQETVDDNAPSLLSLPLVRSVALDWHLPRASPSGIRPSELPWASSPSLFPTLAIRVSANNLNSAYSITTIRGFFQSLVSAVLLTLA